MKRIKTAVWGLGRAGTRQHLPELEKYADRFEIAGCYDILPERMAEVSARTGAKSYASSEAMLSDPEIELVSVVTRHADHVPQGIQVLEAGKYLFIEKPLAISLAESQKLKSVSERHPGRLLCRHNRRFLAEFTAIRRIMDSGVLGDILEVRLSEEWYKRRIDWQTLKSCDGGLLNNWGPHLIDQGLQLLGAPVATVWAHLSHFTAKGDAEDCFKIILHGENDRIVELGACEGAAIGAPYGVVYGNTGMLVTSENRNEIRVRTVDGEKSGAAVQTASADTPEIDLSYADKSLVWREETVKVDRAACDWHDSYRFVYETIREGKEFPIKEAEAFEVVRIMDLVRQSGGQSVSAGWEKSLSQSCHEKN